MAEQAALRDEAEALLLVDVQRAFMSGVQAVPDHLRLRCALDLLLEKARQYGVPVFFLQNDGPEGASDAPGTEAWELFFPPQPGEAVLRKRQDDGFDGTDLEARLRTLGIRVIAFGGVLSEMCLAATARGALARGFTVILAHDVHATYDVPAGPGGSPFVPAHLAARAAEWSLGDEAVLLASATDVEFVALPAEGGGQA
ncbi:isochorismatase family protein [Roseococcus pinisoli]|uniref:Isochorismatase family protein n=1 Tax=Roseococcus pinisoli TaxID=2835040 RepID=A0ABS5QIM7_9PROT|nr:isochorismatase family protein [Roseococcus pinisoli]